MKRPVTREVSFVGTPHCHGDIPHHIFTVQLIAEEGRGRMILDGANETQKVSLWIHMCASDMEALAEQMLVIVAELRAKKAKRKQSS